MTVACEGYTTMKCGHDIQNSQFCESIWLSSVNPKNMFMYWILLSRTGQFVYKKLQSNAGNKPTINSLNESPQEPDESIAPES